MKQAEQHLQNQTFDTLGDFFACLGNPTRLRIIACLVDGERNTGEIVEAIGLSKSAISHQIRLLRDKKVIRYRRAGRKTFIALDDEHVRDLFMRGFEHVRHALPLRP